MRASRAAALLVLALVTAGAALLLGRRAGEDGGGVPVAEDPAVEAPALATVEPSLPAAPGNDPSVERGGGESSSPLPTDPSGTVKVRGTVRVRPGQQPAPNAVIHFHADPRGSTPVAMTHADESGAYSADVPRGTAIPRVDVRPLLGGFVPTTVDLGGRVVADEDRTLDLDVDEGPFVDGVVVDSRTGDPVEGAEVRPDLLGRRSQWTSADGRFRFGGLDERGSLHQREVVLVVRHPGYRAARVGLVPAPSGTSPSGARIELWAGVAISGRVVREDGQRVLGVRVTCYAVSAAEWGRDVRTVAIAETDAAGRFLMPGVDPVVGASLVVAPDLDSGGAGSGTTLRALDLTRDRDDLVLTVPRPVAVTVAAAYPDGRPVAPVDMRVLVEDPETGWWHAARQAPHGVEVPLAEGARVRVVVYARRRAPEGAEDVFRGAEVVAGDPESTKVVVALSPTAPPPPLSKSGRWSAWSPISFAQRTYRLRLVDAADSVSLGGRTMQMIDPHGSGGGASMIDPDGRHDWSVGLGRWPLRIVVDGYEPLDVVVEAVENGSEDVELRLQRSAR